MYSLNITSVMLFFQDFTGSLAINWPGSEDSTDDPSNMHRKHDQLQPICLYVVNAHAVYTLVGWMDEMIRAIQFKTTKTTSHGEASTGILHTSPSVSDNYVRRDPKDSREMIEIYRRDAPESQDQRQWHYKEQKMMFPEHWQTPEGIDWICCV
ncbi:uncharacterized protein BO88DRAFT_411835 [Aspergillus vadensis CBS 113365]|uniref:Uncharacterized protein n=1 Tax=Aspergillus vadensis (strain CBS 113365 / IMI 142717 / IBT 24658) TaxID=1448311 RepID=A0A319C3W3_ASPVC|nr:hypothetical protein BO88DRAFT_411835 [Aspergillus vadensis CBS 113365]PYH72943.1 hypothetical protein BO88DRAFT_411835 [Aspergillus vadensis CBS 113365]